MKRLLNTAKRIHGKMYMGTMCDCLYRLHHHHTRTEQLENKILKYEQFMEQSLVNNSCCDITAYNKNEDKPIYR